MLRYWAWGIDSGSHLTRTPYALSTKPFLLGPAASGAGTPLPDAVVPVRGAAGAAAGEGGDPLRHRSWSAGGRR